MQQVNLQEKAKATPLEWLLANIGRILISILVPVVTFLGLRAGFLFLRDSEAPQLIIAIVAIIWGVGGVAALYWVFNWVLELLPSEWRARLQPFLFVGPAMAILAWYLALPTVRTFWLSLRSADSSQFVGFQNYIATFTQRIMLEAYRNNALWMIVGTFFTVSLGLLIAVLADRSNFENVAKALIFLPMAISMVGAGVIWRFVYDVDPHIGMLNAIVTGLGGEAQAWITLVQPWNNVLLTVIVIWLQTGYAMVLFSAAIKGVPDDLLEAARVDGATETQTFFRIIIPYIQGTIITVMTTVVIFTLKIFDVVMVTTGGQFGTEVIGVRFYREFFNNQNYGYGSAIAIVLLIAVIPVMIYNLIQFSKQEVF
jgi:alpha-glucoside transport system permease protein